MRIKRGSGFAIGLTVGLCLVIGLSGCFKSQNYLPPDAEEEIRRAFTLWDRGQRQEAIQSFKSTMDMHNSARWRSFAAYSISQIYDELGDRVASNAAMDDAKRFGAPSYQATAGMCYSDLGFYEDARRELRQAIKSGLGARRRVAVIYELARVCTELNYFDEAQSNFERILSPDFPKAYAGYALLYERMGNYSNAREMWRQYLEHDPNGEFADMAREHTGGLGHGGQ